MWPHEREKREKIEEMTKRETEKDREKKGRERKSSFGFCKREISQENFECVRVRVCECMCASACVRVRVCECVCVCRDKKLKSLLEGFETKNC